ncbi:MAG: DNA polymerase III subunit beta [Thermodesulfobacteriota bacterium]
MKLKVNKEEIINGTQKSAAIIPVKTGAAYLRITWLRAQDNTLEIMSTDSNMEFTGKYKTKIEENGLVGVNGRKFADLIQRMPPGEITMRLGSNGQILYLEQGRKKYKLPTNESSWFQELAPFPDDYFIWSGEELKNILEKTIFCIADKESLKNIVCLSMKARDDGRIEVCGLDGTKIAIYIFENENMYNILKEQNILFEKDYLNELRRWLPNDDIKIGLSDKKIFFADKNEIEMFSMPLKSGEFPKYRNILDNFRENQNTSIEFYREEMLDSLERIALFTTSEFQSVHIKIFDDYIFMDYQGQESGEAYEEIEAKINGEIKEIILATRHIISILNHFDSEKITFSLSDKSDPCFISGEDDPGYTCITMPITIEEETYYTEEEV